METLGATGDSFDRQHPRQLESEQHGRVSLRTPS